MPRPPSPPTLRELRRMLGGGCTWTVLRFASGSTRDNRRWLCRCGCGAEHAVLERTLRRGESLRCRHCRAVAGNESSTDAHAGVSLPALRTLRRAARMSQDRLAALSGVSQDMISLLERGRKGTTPEKAQALAAALGVGVAELTD